MDKQITELVRLINKGVESLPGTLQNLVAEYARQQMVMAIMMLVLMIVFIPLAIFSAKAMINHWHTAAGEYYATLEMFLTIAFGTLSIAFMLKFCIYTSNALAPTLSLIQSLR